MTRFLIIGVLGAALLAAPQQTASQDSAPIRMRTLRPGDILYVLIGGGGNTLALMRDEGVVIIDTKLPGRGRQIQDIIQAVSDKPVATIINTHAHADHVGGNPELGATTIVAHERAKAAMGKLALFQGPNARFLPNTVVTDRLSLLDGPDRIELYYFGAGHTDGDLVVVFPEKRLAYFGDLFSAKAVPAIDPANGGSAVAFPETLARAAAEIKGVVQVVTGHEQGLVAERDPRAASVDISTPRMMRWADVQEYAEFTRDFLGEVQKSMAGGKSAAETAASLKLPEKYQDYDMRNTRAAVEAIYQELRK
jgi:glyoxylase-like metal-dependent hydrolase (beta-lactamase superfamily II)